MTKLFHLNALNGADILLTKYVELAKVRFPGEPITVVLMGIAYGGDVEMCARLLPGRGHVFGFDTFEDRHPRHLTHSPGSLEDVCMEDWYRAQGTERLALSYQRSQLDEMGLTNTTLVKGEVRPDSCASIPRIHVAFLDMDMNASMRTGFHAVAGKIVPGGFLAAHDVVPQGHITNNYEIFHNELVKPSEWEQAERFDASFFIAWRKR